MNKPVSFELAKLLKEKGFESKSHIAEYWNVEGKQLLVETWEDEYDSFHHEDCPDDITFVCLAPTIAQLVMWLWEKHGIWISILCDVGYDTLFTYKLYSTKIGSEHCIKNGDRYDLPTEAYEAAIEYILNNLL